MRIERRSKLSNHSEIPEKRFEFIKSIGGELWEEQLELT